MRLYYETDFPLRGKIQPVHDKYKFKDKRNSTVYVPGWASGTEPNNPIPVQKENNFDFTYSTFGPPDLPIPSGVAGKGHYVRVENNKPKLKRTFSSVGGLLDNVDRSFYKGPQDMVEHFVTMPFTLNTDLPCSVIGFKF